MTTRYYFACGSNMNVAQMKYRCPTAVLIGVAKLPKHRFLINTRGVASVEPDEKADVYGVLWEITAADEAALDRYEGLDRGLYVKRMVDVQADSGVLSALIYLATNKERGSPRPGYLDIILKGARENGLPSEYTCALKAWRH